MMIQNDDILVVNTDLIKVVKRGKELIPYIAFSKGGWLEHNSFTAEKLEGFLAALMLAADVVAGKFYPARIVSDEGDPDLNDAKQDVIRRLRTHDRKLLGGG